MGNTLHGSRRKGNAENEKKGEPMNKRQAKKQYKKMHGHNPPSAKRLQAAERDIYAEHGLTPEQVAATVKGAKRAMAAIARAFAGAGQALAETMTTVAENLESEG